MKLLKIKTLQFHTKKAYIFFIKGRRELFFSNNKKNAKIAAKRFLCTYY